MRVLSVHNRYQRPGGEDVVADAEAALLARAGHEVVRYETTNDQISSLADKVRTFRNVAFSDSARREFGIALSRAAPDVVHIHNYFPLLTPAIFHECKAQGRAVVHTLHNFRPICMNGFLLRDGLVCEKCLGRSPYHGVLHRCYRDSVAGSVAVARMISSQRRTGWYDTVDRFIALTRFARDKFVEGGLPGERIAVKPNFVTDPGVFDPSRPRSGALFVGRLSEEKGLRTLIEAWRGIDTPLRIAGSGPMEHELRAMAGGNVNFLGTLSRGAVYDEMARASVLVMPSTWYEGFPVTVVEAYACGLPIIASRLGSMAELIDDGETGLHFTPADADDLVRAVRSALGSPYTLAALSAGARRRYEQCYTSERNAVLLADIYRDAITASKTTGSAPEPGGTREPPDLKTAAVADPAEA